MERARALGRRSGRLPRAGPHRLPARGPPVQARVHRGQPAGARRRRPGTAAASPRCVGLRGQARRHLQRRRRAARRRARGRPTTSSTCRTTASSTRTATSRPGRSRRSSAAATTVRRRQHLRGHLVSDGADDARRPWPGAELVVTINASPYHAGKARPREDARHARGRRPRVPGLREPGGRAGRAGLRRPVLDLQREGRVRRAAAGRSRRTCSSPTSTSTRSSARACTTRGGARRSSGRRARRCRRVALSPLPARDRGPRCRRATHGVPRAGRGVYQALVLGTRDYVTKNGFRHVVLGLSGGIDSALVAAIAVRRARAGQRHRRHHAVALLVRRHAARTPARLARNLGIEFMHAADHAASSRRYRRALAKAVQGAQGGRRPRRTSRPASAAIYLMALSNKFGWLVLTTGNKSEIGRRVQHALRRHGRRLRGDQGRAEDARLRSSPSTPTRGPAAS